MKILHFTQDMSAGGVEAIICNLVNEMVKEHDVTLGTIYAINPEQVYEKKLDSHIKRISLGKTGQGVSIKILLNLLCIIWKSDFDVIHIHGWFYYFFLPVFLLHRNKKFFYTIHSDAKMENTPMDMKIIKLKRLCFKRSYIHPITISKPSQESFTNFYGAHSKLIYNGVKRNSTTTVSDYDYKITSKTKVFIHPARISREKNQEVLVRVFSRLINEGKDIVLLIAGQNRDTEIFDKLKPYFSDRIQYIGVRSDIPQLMSFCYGFCLPSIWEGLPVSLLESLSSGCIPACSPVGGIVAAVQHGKNGFLSVSSSEDDYYTTMLEVCELDEQQAADIKANCIKSFAKFDIVGTAANYVTYYKEICGKA